MSPPLSADKPLVNPKDDELGYLAFAQNIANSILNMSPSDGLVISIYGNWGSGKSTVLNFIKYFLKKKNDNKHPLIIDFNPWWFTGREGLTRLLIGLLSINLGKKDYKEVKKILAGFVEIVSNIPNVPVGKAGDKFAEQLRGEPDLSALKEKINKLLLIKKQKILVIIDDIDRLSIDEIQDLFRSIKAVANFPNVIYLLAFDVNVVSSSLDKIFPGSGKSYIEKIIQVPFELPLPDKEDIRRLLFKKLDIIFQKSPLANLDYWTNIYYECIDFFINTPRDIIRLTNALMSTYPSIIGEVNPVDFIAIETIRVFLPPLYEIIRVNKDTLTGITPFDFGASRKDKYRDIYQKWLDQMPDQYRDNLKRSLSRLFPRFGEALGGPAYTSDFQTTWRKQLRICSPEIFNIFFRFSIPTDYVTVLEIKEIVDATKDATLLSDLLLKNVTRIKRDGTSRIRGILEWLQDYTEEDILVENIPNVINALYSIGDALIRPEDQSSGIFDIGNDLLIGRLRRQLLSRLNQKERFDILSNAIINGDSLALQESEVAVLGQEHGKFGGTADSKENDRTVNAEQLTKLEELVLEKIRKAAKNGMLLTKPNLVSILHRWSSWANKIDEVQLWLLEISENDNSLASLLVQFSRTQKENIIGDYAIHKKYRLDPKWLEPFINPDQIIGKVRKLQKISNNNFSTDQIKAINQFVKEYDLRSEGKNPELIDD